MTAVYKIENLATGFLYVGSAINEVNRRRRHFKDLRDNNHHSRYLQRAFNKYGSHNFCFSIIESVDDKAKLLEREQFWIDLLKPAYNLSKFAGNTLGVKHTDEVVRRNKERNTGFNNGNCKIREVQFREIVEKRKYMSQQHLADEYGVNRTTIQRIEYRYGVPKRKIYNQAAKNTLRKNGKRTVLHTRKPVAQLTKEGAEVKRFISLTEAAKETGFSINSILNSVKNYTLSDKNRKCFFKYL